MFFVSFPHLFLTLPSMPALMLRQSDETGIPHLLCFGLLRLTDVFFLQTEGKTSPSRSPTPAERSPLALFSGLEPNLHCL